MDAGASSGKATNYLCQFKEIPIIFAEKRLTGAQRQFRLNQPFLEGR